MAHGRRRWPLGLPTLPLDPTIKADAYDVRLSRTREGWRAELVDEWGMVIDEFRGHDAADVLADVSRNYPGAVFDAEAGT